MGQFFKVAHAANILLPAGQSLIDRLNPLKLGNSGGKSFESFSVQKISHSHTNFLKARKDIEFGQGKTSEAIDGMGVAQGHEVQPAAPAGPAGGCPVLPSRLPQLLAQ